MRPRSTASTCLLLLSTIVGAVHAENEPNFVFIMFDDLGYGSFGRFWDHAPLGQNTNGGRRIDTPAIDALAVGEIGGQSHGEGLMFTQYYANAPVCSPTRAAIQTGRLPADIGLRTITTKTTPEKGIPINLPTLPEQLQSEGYYTGHVGKWHLGGNPYPEFEPVASGYDYTATLVNSATYYTDLVVNGTVEPAGSVHLTERLVDRAIDFVDEVPTDTPFFLNLWLLTPHKPFCEVPSGLALPFDDELDFHAALITNADSQLARLFQHLATANRIDNTIIVVTSDNGAYALANDSRGSCLEPCCADSSCPDPADCLPEPVVNGRDTITNGRLRSGKRSVFEGGIRVPMILFGPDDRVSATATIDEPVAAMDIFPTFLDIAGLATPADAAFDGQSFAPVLTGGSLPAVRAPIFWEHKDPRHHDDVTFAIRDGQHKLVKSGLVGFSPSRFRLFDTTSFATDPNETNPNRDLLGGCAADLPLSCPNAVAGAVARAEDLLDEYRRLRREATAFPLDDSTSIGFVNTTTNASGQVSIHAWGGHLELAADARFDLAVDDFTFSVWINPDVTALSDANPSIIADKAGSWRLALDGNNNLTLSVAGRPCDAGDFNCQPTPATLTLPTALADDRWYLATFNLFHNHDQFNPSDPLVDSSVLSLSLWQTADPDHLTLLDTMTLDPGTDLGIRAVQSTMNPLTIAAGAGGTDSFSGQLFDPQAWNTVLDDLETGIEAFATCSSDNENHAQFTGTPGPTGNAGEDWAGRELRQQVPQCCNPSVRCNDGHDCRQPGTTGVPLESNFGTACARTLDSTGNLHPGPSLVACTDGTRGDLLEHYTLDAKGNPVIDDRFCCAFVVTQFVAGYQFVPMPHPECPGG